MNVKTGYEYYDAVLTPLFSGTTKLR